MIGNSGNNRSVQDAVRTGQKLVQSGKGYVVDIDLKSFFDEVDHDKLMHLLDQHVEDKSLKKLIGAILRAPVQRPDGSRWKKQQLTSAGFNRRMRKSACPVVWKAHRA